VSINIESPDSPGGFNLPLWLRYRTHAAVSFLCFELGQTTHVLAGLVLVTEKLADEEQSLKQRLVADIWIKTDHASSARVEPEASSAERRAVEGSRLGLRGDHAGAN